MKKTMSLKQLSSLSRKVVFKRTLSLTMCAVVTGTFLTSGLNMAKAATTTGTLVAGKTYDAYPALKDVYKDYFTMGDFGSADTNALTYNFSSFTPGNEMKPESTENVKGTFTFESCDNLFNNISKADPNMQFYGHTLGWHSQTPTWMWDAPPAANGQPGTYDKATALANLKNHVDGVLEHFGGRIQGIDVVNEAVQNPTPDDWKASLAPQGCWYSALGSEWVEDTFLEAAKVVDSHPDWNVKLRYNDFGLDDPKKAQTVFAMVKDINARYANARPNGKPLIEVIGMQAHYNSTTNPDNVENAIKLFATLPGVKVNITESDVGAPPIGKLTPDNENNQAVEWAKLFQIYKKYAAGPANTTGNPKVIDRIDICGIRDATGGGWRAGDFALLFDSNGLAKQALLAVIDPDGFLATHKYIDVNHGVAPAHVNGIYTYSQANGDAWTGANIILGTNANQWPWSTAGDDGKVAFTPEKDATYRLSFNYTSNGTSAIRVRWVKDNTNGGYTKADSSAQSNFKYSAAQTSTTIPGYFNSGMVAAGSYTLTTVFKMDGSQGADGLIGNIAIRGGAGGSAYTLNWIKVEKIGTNGEADKLLVNWPQQAPNSDSDSVDQAVKAIQGGIYTIPYTAVSSQDTKTAWVQSAVNALIPSGNGSKATVTYNNGYVVSVSKGTVTKPATIAVNGQKNPTNTPNTNNGNNNQGNQNTTTTSKQNGTGISKLPQTGGFLDTNMLVVAGISMLLGGIFLLVVGKNKHRRFRKLLK